MPNAANKFTRLVYKRTESQWRFFLEYRLKLLVRYYVVLAACVVAGGWLWQQGEGGQMLLFLCFLAYATASYVFLRLEQRIRHMLVICHYVGAQLEGRMAQRPDKRGCEEQGENDLWATLKAGGAIGVLDGLSITFRHTSPHGGTLSRLYLCSIVIGLLGTLLCLIVLNAGLVPLFEAWVPAGSIPQLATIVVALAVTLALCATAIRYMEQS